MKQVLIKKGKAYVDEIPTPICGKGEILIEVRYSLISTGTELTSVTESGKSLWQKAKEQPENVKLAIDLMKKQGFKKTLNLIRGVLESGNPTGYSAAGKVIDVGKEVLNFKKGDRVAAAGAGFANHAEIIAVPKNLVVKIPEGVELADAASVTLGAIALQGLRQAESELGETVVVIGLGLVGLLMVQLLKAAGCHIIGIDPEAKRRKMAREFGAEQVFSPEEEIIKKIMQKTIIGADKVIICAATKSDQPINQAMQMVRQKGLVVIVGAVGLNLKRSPFYEKEAELRISCSYGPGRYDENYEIKGQDYPPGYVRWTENRNMQEYLNLIAQGKINFKKMAEKKFLIDEAGKAYQSLTEDSQKPLAVLLKYPGAKNVKNLIKISYQPQKINPKLIKVAVIGAGGFASSVHLPNLEKLRKDYKIQAIIDRNGAKAKNLATKFQAKYAGTDYQKILTKKDLDLVLIATRHNTHAQIAIEALKAGKAVFCEKPAALNQQELDKLVKTIRQTKKPYLVGFNRRFSPYAKKIKQIIQNRESPLMISYRMNAGFLPSSHWTQTAEGGGRIIGEACHILDLFNYLIENEVIEIQLESINPRAEHYLAQDNFNLVLKYADGSVAQLLYTALGSQEFGKEYLELYFDGKTIILDDYQKMKGYGVSANLSTTEPDKGHFQELVEFSQALRNGQNLISLEDIISATQLSFQINDKIFKNNQ